MINYLSVRNKMFIQNKVPKVSVVWFPSNLNELKNGDNRR